MHLVCLTINAPTLITTQATMSSIHVPVGKQAPLSRLGARGAVLASATGAGPSAGGLGSSHFIRLAGPGTSVVRSFSRDTLEPCTELYVISNECTAQTACHAML